MEGAFAGGQSIVRSLDEEFDVGGAGDQDGLGRQGGVLIRVRVQAGRIGEGYLNRLRNLVRHLGPLRRQEELLVALGLARLAGSSATAQHQTGRG
jgi:hypothetical protein